MQRHRLIFQVLHFLFGVVAAAPLLVFAFLGIRGAGIEDTLGTTLPDFVKFLAGAALLAWFVAGTALNWASRKRLAGWCLRRFPPSGGDGPERLEASSPVTGG